MLISLSSLVNNLSEGLYNDKCKDCKSCLDYMLAKDNQLVFKSIKYNKNYKKEFNENLVNRFANIYEFCNEDINKFILLLRKGVYLKNIRILGKSLMKNHCLIEKIFIAP